MCWPSSLRRRKSMNLGPTTIDRTIASRPAAMTRSMRLDLRRRQSLRHPFESCRPGRLHEHDVTGPHQLVHGADRLRDAGGVALLRHARAEIAARELAHRHEYVGVRGR